LLSQYIDKVQFQVGGTTERPSNIKLSLPMCALPDVFPRQGCGRFRRAPRTAWRTGIDIYREGKSAPGCNRVFEEIMKDAPALKYCAPQFAARGRSIDKGAAAVGRQIHRGGGTR
jgi:hypothetical protein